MILHAKSMAPDVVSTADTQSKGLSRLGFLVAWHESKEIAKFHYDLRIDPGLPMSLNVCAVLKATRTT